MIEKNTACVSTPSRTRRNPAKATTISTAAFRRQFLSELLHIKKRKLVSRSLFLLTGRHYFLILIVSTTVVPLCLLAYSVVTNRPVLASLPRLIVVVFGIIKFFVNYYVVA